LNFHREDIHGKEGENRDFAGMPSLPNGLFPVPLDGHALSDCVDQIQVQVAANHDGIDNEIAATHRPLLLLVIAIRSIVRVDPVGVDHHGAPRVNHQRVPVALPLGIVPARLGRGNHVALRLNGPGYCLLISREMGGERNKNGDKLEKKQKSK
jgi:hypothetical protein